VPPFASTPVVSDVGAVFDDVLLAVFQFNQQSVAVPPAVFAVVAPVPAVPQLKNADPLAVN
jgi:hypothetical protein